MTGFLTSLSGKDYELYADQISTEQNCVSSDDELGKSGVVEFKTKNPLAWIDLKLVNSEGENCKISALSKVKVNASCNLNPNLLPPGIYPPGKLFPNKGTRWEVSCQVYLNQRSGNGAKRDWINTSGGLTYYTKEIQETSRQIINSEQLILSDYPILLSWWIWVIEVYDGNDPKYTSAGFTLKENEQNLVLLNPYVANLEPGLKITKVSNSFELYFYDFSANSKLKIVAKRQGKPTISFSKVTDENGLLVIRTKRNLDGYKLTVYEATVPIFTKSLKDTGNKVS